ncbi:ubiquitin carboxyl-terminal hydrolase 25-like isoform X2 [Equus przewalskii]|uniref:Ubiquitin carboxyl-terminal hydrolase 25-like isoform X2 n=1 Tax=Equus przewalskii TaxID=9798 RepID=A0ABM4JVL1_EQUPR
MPTRTRCATIEQSKNGSKDKRDLDVIDLTGDDEDDLQRAIALSLAESNRAFRETGMTDEEQAISRVLEASIAENKACLKRTPTEVWRDSRNPYDRKRQDKAPVGLKNVGNTCWFSAVIQSLFNLLEFRRLVLNYKASITCSRFTPKPKGKITFPESLAAKHGHMIQDWPMKCEQSGCRRLWENFGLNQSMKTVDLFPQPK